MGKRIVSLAVLAVTACADQGFGEPVLDFETIADVRGESDAPCVLELSSASATVTYDIAATALPPTTTPTTRAALGTCTDNGATVAVNAMPHGGAPPLNVIRGPGCMTILSGASDSNEKLADLLGVTTADCPTTIAFTLSCAGTVVYDHTTFGVCVVPM